MIDLSKLTIKSAREGLKKGDFTSRELTEACIDKIKKEDGEINAFIEVFDDALGQADAADEQIKKGIEAPLLGVPIAIKDNILLSGHKSSAGSHILEGFVSPTDSTVSSKLQRHGGAVIVGRTNMDEFAMGSSTETSYYGPTKNPTDTSRVPGGSSGGSAAALAAHFVLGSLGTDTGGSIRQPAALTGIVGLKPTYGRVSRSGIIALGSSLDQVGPFAHTVTDVETIYNVIKGEDKLDSTTISDSTYKSEKKFNKTIGVPRKFLKNVSSDVKKNFEQAEEKFKSLGYKIMDVDLPSIEYSLAAYYIIMPAEASTNLARYDGVKYGLYVDGTDLLDDYMKTKGSGFGRETRRRIILGTFVLSSGYYDSFYGAALLAKEKITDELREAFKDIDVLLTPSTSGPAFKIGEKISDPLSMYLEDIFTVPANISGIPSMSLPSGFVEVEGKNLPLGILLSSDLGREDNLFQIGKDFLGE
ncbi:Asp-tRNA(Asn)/Glu-tRNA(Gln) amidotransferase subunit GatA [Candidatus Parcubacteria bacterium]|nr:Asp-tRNA(Asn)/Glu-tRNA(Gln) amidotransferase subunit GatA [Candidatus Parcubacteria bacterium]